MKVLIKWFTNQHETISKGSRSQYKVIWFNVHFEHWFSYGSHDTVL